MTEKQLNYLYGLTGGLCRDDFGKYTLCLFKHDKIEKLPVDFASLLISYYQQYDWWGTCLSMCRDEYDTDDPFAIEIQKAEKKMKELGKKIEERLKYFPEVCLQEGDFGYKKEN